MKKLVLLFFAFAVFSSCTKGLVYSLVVDKSVVLYPAFGGKDSVYVQANAAWDVQVGDDCKDWVEVTPTHSDYIWAYMNVYIKEPNTSGKEKRGSIYIRNGEAMREITIIQQDMSIDKSMVYGTWQITECDSKGMINSVFEFRNDGSCTAKMMGMNIVGTFELVGNLIKITAAGKEVVIAVKSITVNSMTSVVMGKYDAKLIKL